MWRRILPIAGIVVLALGLPIYGAGDAPLDRATLRGLKAVNVVIDKIDPQLEQQGLTAGSLKERIEERLRRAGVAIDPAAREFLGLRVMATPPERRQPYAVGLTIGVYQPVTLARDKEMRTATQTWEAATVLLAQPKFLLPASSDAVDELADRFTAAWRSVNP